MLRHVLFYPKYGKITRNCGNSMTKRLQKPYLPHFCAKKKKPDAKIK